LGFPTSWSFTTHKESSGAVDKDLKNKKPTSTTRQQALLMAVERWCPYHQRAEFLIKTDHHSLCYLDDQQLQSPLQKKAMARLMGLQFRIIYRKGAKNLAADALSRVSHLMAIRTQSTVQPAWLQEVLNSYVTDAEAQRRLTELALNSPGEHGYDLQEGIIRFHGRVWIGANSALKTKLITSFHSSAIGGHSGADAIYQRVKRLFAWPGLKAQVTDFVRQCDTFQHAKHSTTHTLPAFSSRCQFPLDHGKTSRWTSSRACLSLMGPILSWWWLIALLSLPISFHYGIHLLLLPWLVCLWTRW
jgi:hypothetical protein